MSKREPIADLTNHNIQREKDVRAATKRLDDYLVEKYDLNKTAKNVSNIKSEAKPKTDAAQNSKPKEKMENDKENPPNKK